MSLSTKRFLCLCDDPKAKLFVQTTLTPVVKFVVFAGSDQDAIGKANNSEFDCIILRTLKPTLDDPKKFFQWSKLHKNIKALPWVVLGKDVESEQHLVQHRNLKFLEKADDGAALIKLLDNLLVPVAGGSPAIDVNFINPFVSAVQTVIESMAQIKLNRMAPYLKKPGMPQAAIGDVSGIIAMNSDKFLGSVAMCYQEDLILKIFNNMMGATARDINEDVKDAVAELTNIIFGNAKRDLNVIGHTIQPAIPSVVTGKNHEIRHSVEGVNLVIPFESISGKMVVECVMRSKI